MSKIHTLGIVPQPSVDEASRRSTVKLLTDVLRLAEKGEVSEVLVIARHPGNDAFTTLVTETVDFTRWIGQLETLKFIWLMDHQSAVSDIE